MGRKILCGYAEIAVKEHSNIYDINNKTNKTSKQTKQQHPNTVPLSAKNRIDINAFTAFNQIITLSLVAERRYRCQRDIDGETIAFDVLDTAGQVRTGENQIPKVWYYIRRNIGHLLR